MKRFQRISIVLLTMAALALCADIAYMIGLYKSIRTNMEREVNTALVDMDINEMWYRVIKRNNSDTNRTQTQPHDKRTIKGTMRNDEFVTEESTAKDGTQELSRKKLTASQYYTNFLLAEMSAQLHQQLDETLPPSVEALDSILRETLRARNINPGFVAVEMVDKNGKVLMKNPRLTADKPRCEVFAIKHLSETGVSYRAYMTPLTELVLKRMVGVISITLLLIVIFTVTYLYQVRTIRRLRSIEDMKDDFVNNMTHELKTPIAVAYSAADSLKRYYDESTPEHNKEYIDIILKQLSVNTVMVENILSMSMERRKTMLLDIKPLEVLPLLQDVCKTQQVKAKKPVKITYDVEPKNMVVKTDHLHFANVVGNLIDNAIKYSGESVNIDINVDEHKMSISDNGIGMTNQQLEHIFERFYRVRNDAVSGYGIGLYYVKHICKLMGWSISAESKVGVGSVFVIKFESDEK